jgi:16S rRNA processing protein RimM
MDVYTDFPERIQAGVMVYVGPEHQPMQITGRRTHQRGLLLSFNDYRTREEVAEIRSMLVHVPAADRPQLPEGEYYQHQLLGLQVLDEHDSTLGWITGILETGANDVYIVEDSEGKELLIPAIESVVLGIDLEKKQVRVHLLPGLVPGR